MIKAGIIFLIIFYRRWISPLKRPACRFYPSCSCYALQAVRKYGSIRGLAFAVRSLSRCHPFHHGGYDPLP